MQHNKSKQSIIAEYYSLHYDELKAFVASRIQYAEDCEDIVQNVFLRLLRMDKMITTITLPCLVYTVARNLIFDYWRHKRKVEEYEHTISKDGWQKEYIQDTESVYSAQEIYRLLENGIAQLTANQQKVYRMNIFEGKQVSDIAMELHINYKSAENRLGAARKQIRGYMSGMLAS